MSLLEGREGLRELSDRERQLMTRMLSDPQLFPLPFKTWLTSWMEASDLVLPLSSVSGLNDRLAALTATKTLAGLANASTDVSGFLHVAFSAPVSAVQSVVLTNSDLAHLNVNLSAVNWDIHGFDIVAWDMAAGAALASTVIKVAWLAFVTP